MFLGKNPLKAALKLWIAKEPLLLEDLKDYCRIILQLAVWSFYRLRLEHRLDADNFTINNNLSSNTGLLNNSRKTRTNYRNIE